MKAPLRITLTLFSFPALQSWVILIFGALLGIGIVVRQFELSAVAATIIAVHPTYFGGLVLRIVSSPTVLHLRPHGRRRILLGATGTITLVALLETVPVLVFELAGLRIPDRSSVFDLPTLGTFQFFWGATALLWVWAFFASRNNLLFGFTWIPMGAVFLLVGTLHLTAVQLANALSVIGAVVWTGFAGWYMQTPSVVRPDWLTNWSRGQSPPDFVQLLGRLRAGTPADAARVSRPLALRQYLTGSGSMWSPVLMGAAFTLLIAVLILFGRSGMRVEFLMYVTLLSASPVYILVRRARLLWLRTELDRSGLFAAAERHTLRSQLATFMVPAAVLLTLALVERPDLAMSILLFTATQFIVATCFQYAGLAVTTGWNARSIGIFAMLGLLFMVMTITLQPHRGAFVWTYIAAMVVFGGLALVFRRAALRGWQRLDWRVAGSLPAGVGRQGN